MPLIDILYRGVPGTREESTLDKLEGVVDNDNEYTTWVEYRIGEEVVHRSAHVTLKTGTLGTGFAGEF